MSLSHYVVAEFHTWAEHYSGQIASLESEIGWKKVLSCFIKKHTLNIGGEACIHRKAIWSFTGDELPPHSDGECSGGQCSYPLAKFDWTLEMRLEVWLRYSHCTLFALSRSVDCVAGGFQTVTNWQLVTSQLLAKTQANCQNRRTLRTAAASLDWWACIAVRLNIEFMKLTYLIKMSPCPSNYGLWRK